MERICKNGTPAIKQAMKKAEPSMLSTSAPYLPKTASMLGWNPCTLLIVNPLHCGRKPNPSVESFEAKLKDYKVKYHGERKEYYQNGQLTLIELMPNVTLEEVRSKTAAKFVEQLSI